MDHHMWGVRARTEDLLREAEQDRRAARAQRAERRQRAGEDEQPPSAEPRRPARGPWTKAA
ncbi:hypothetical protein QNO07_22085 [Streptomyces sp. 549]|uniref:hypothetical protein n=1 Tax=Streptomyces sp. 549 TaxID=3049076 RepID=UPI0024C4164A|nr:hypothetical protein [Streptomyces sp. 549]MDK1476076.1 hypothetical protein [Streptomyces sp. 549]